MQSELGFSRTDGDSSLWPSNTRRIVDREGQVNYMHPLESDDPQCIRWREDLGRLVAEKIGLPAGPKYTLGSWPGGYKMFVHYKGPQDNPRTDKYLFGSTLVKRFRSVPEFALHAVWLMMDENLQRSNCGCKYCTRTPQRGISQAAGLTTSARPVSSPVARIRQSTQAPSKAPRPPPQTPSFVVGREKERISESPSVTAGRAKTSPHPSPPPQPLQEQEQTLHPKEVPWFAIRKEPKPVKPSTGPKVAVSPHRVVDLEGMNSPHRKRLHRIGEVIWCFLDVPIARLGEEDSAIGAWPGIVKSVQRSMHVTIVVGESSVEHRRSRDQPYLYEVSLFNIDAVITIPDERVLPYQAMSSPQPLLDALSSLMHTIDRKTHMLNVSAEGGLDALSKFAFEEAALPYALAVQAPIMLAKYWTCTDTWTFKYTITANRAIATPVVPKKKYRTPGLHIGPMPDLLPSISAGPVALPAESPAQVKTQKRYQGLWWGGERIWVDDLVRLKVPRRELAPNGSERVLPTVPPSQTTVEYTIQKGMEPDHAPGSGDRGLFLRITSIFVVEKKVRISGMLFDLVEDGFVGEGVGGREGRQEDTSAFDMRTLDPALLQVENPDAPQAEWTSNGFKPASDRRILSGPYVRSWNPPEPPTGYKFRSILKGDWEAVMDVSLLSGRYYPGVLSNPLLSDHVERLLRLKESVHHLYALEGLAPGYYNSVDPEFPKENRQVMLREAVAEARNKCEEWFDKEAVSNLLDPELTNTSDVEMDEDED
ncbi:hypothetical protein BDM02DRAFT_3185686 [Thelephora ganbajun]|uniref:Uncharacterized protein n=1 Tax=Thelephora ganbajun TaxID=370292 RepID=A0ACB6ZK35_THEGA|nr:hypothetical protein BDM02DRAFT_3185686 [Thelephora ganbajun]